MGGVRSGLSVGRSGVGGRGVGAWRGAYLLERAVADPLERDAARRAEAFAVVLAQQLAVSAQNVPVLALRGEAESGPNLEPAHVFVVGGEGRQD